MRFKILFFSIAVLLFVSCGEYNKVLKSTDREVRYEYAKKYFEEKKYGRTITLLESILTSYVGSAKEQEIMYLLAQSYFYNKDYVTSTYYYTKYYNKFPRGEYAMIARYNAAYGLYLDSPDVRLDQSNTYKAIQGFQDFLEYYPKSEKVQIAQDLMFELQEKLAEKQFLAAKLYFNLGMYGGNNYEACVVTARGALQDYPFSAFADDLQFLIVKSKFEEASHSVDFKKNIRFREVRDEHYNYLNMFPEGKNLKDSQKLYRKSMQELGLALDSDTVKQVEVESANNVQ